MNLKKSVNSVIYKQSKLKLRNYFYYRWTIDKNIKNIIKFLKKKLGKNDTNFKIFLILFGHCIQKF